MKVLLCIMSGQLPPNLLSVFQYKPDYLVLIETKFSKPITQNFLASLRNSRYDFSSRHSVESLDADKTDEHNFCKMTEYFSLLQKKYEEKLSDVEWIVNLTGGTKPMSIGAYQAFKDSSAELIYVEQKRIYRFVGNNEKGIDICSDDLSLKSFVLAYGFDVESSRESSGGNQIWETSRVIASYAAKGRDGNPLGLQLKETERKNMRKGNSNSVIKR